MSEFFEAIWLGEGVGDGGDLEEALQAYLAVKPEDGDWVEACAAEGADPVIERFASFESYLDNADPLDHGISSLSGASLDPIALLRLHSDEGLQRLLKIPTVADALAMPDRFEEFRHLSSQDRS